MSGPGGPLGQALPAEASRAARPGPPLPSRRRAGSALRRGARRGRLCPPLPCPPLPAPSRGRRAGARSRTGPAPPSSREPLRPAGRSVGVSVCRWVPPARPRSARSRLRPRGEWAPQRALPGEEGEGGVGERAGLGGGGRRDGQGGGQRGAGRRWRVAVGPPRRPTGGFLLTAPLRGVAREAVPQREENRK